MSKAASPSAQVLGLEKEAGYLHINDGTNKADAQQALRDAGITNFHDISKQIGFYESKTLTKYNGILKQYIQFEKSEGRTADIRAFTADKADAFLQYKFEMGISTSQMLSYCKAFSKLEGMLETVSHDWKEQNTAKVDTLLENWRTEINDAARSIDDKQSRAYTDAAAVVAAVEDPRAHLAAELQLETGLRVHDVTFVRLNADGTLDVNSKAGYRVANFPIPANLATELRGFADKFGISPTTGGKLCFNLISYGDYRTELKAAAQQCGERFSGTHSLRVTFSVNLYNELRGKGYTDKQARQELAERLFHGRISVTYFYVGKGSE